MGYLNLDPNVKKMFDDIKRQIDLSLKSFRFTAPVVSRDPSGPRNGDLWLNSTTNLLKYIDNFGLPQAVGSGPEILNITGAFATGVNAVDLLTSYIWWYNTAASANGTINFRANGSNSLDSLLATGNSLTCAIMILNGATPYYPNVIQIDGNSVTPKWAGGTAPAAGNASSIDVYTFSILKTATATFTVLGTQTQFK